MGSALVQFVSGSDWEFEGHTVRIEEDDGEFLIPAVDVARCIGYGEPEKRGSEVLARNPDDFEGFTRLRNLRSRAGNGVRTQCLTEQGVYVFCMLARTPLATKFRRAVANHLQQLRKHGMVAQLQATMIQALLPTITAIVQQTAAATVEGVLRGVQERELAIVSAVATLKEQLGTLKRTAKHLERRPLQMVMPVDDVTDLTPTTLIPLKKLRELRRMKQKEVAVYLGISRSDYSKIEQGLEEPTPRLRRMINHLFQTW